MSLISIVVPTHNEKPNIAPLYERLRAVFDGLAGDEFELIFCDDSRDDTPREIARLHEADPRVKLIRLSRRFSQAVAITAGMDRASGDAVVLMDADLQDPPEAIPRLLALWRQGNEIVYVERQSGSGYFLYTLFARIFYRLMRKLASVEIPLDAGEFRLLDRKVVDFLKKLTEHTRFLRGLTVWPGLHQAKIQIQRAPRLSGATNYNFRRSLLVAVDGLVSFSIVPLRWATIVGAMVSAFSLIVGFGYLVARLMHPAGFGVGWPSLFVSLYFLGGVQLMFLGVLGEYVGRIFIEVQNRPVYWVDFTLGFRDAEKPPKPLS